MRPFFVFICLVLSLLFFNPLNAAEQLGVNINTASAEEMAQALNGVGLSKARAIVLYRQQNGPFENISELVHVKGIGESTVERNRERIRFKE